MIIREKLRKWSSNFQSQERRWGIHEKFLYKPMDVSRVSIRGLQKLASSEGKILTINTKETERGEKEIDLWYRQHESPANPKLRKWEEALYSKLTDVSSVSETGTSRDRLSLRGRGKFRPRKRKEEGNRWKSGFAQHEGWRKNEQMSLLLHRIEV